MGSLASYQTCILKTIAVKFKLRSSLVTYHSIKGDLERADSWDNFIASVFIVIIGDKLAVDVGHCPYLWDHVENDFAVWITLLDGGGNYIQL